MYAQVEKPKEKKSRAVANSVAHRKSNSTQGFGFVDNREEVATQRNVKKMYRPIMSITNAKLIQTTKTKNKNEIQCQVDTNRKKNPPKWMRNDNDFVNDLRHTESNWSVEAIMKAYARRHGENKYMLQFVSNLWKEEANMKRSVTMSAFDQHVAGEWRAEQEKNAPPMDQGIDYEFPENKGARNDYGKTSKTRAVARVGVKLRVEGYNHNKKGIPKGGWHAEDDIMCEIDDKIKNKDLVGQIVNIWINSSPCPRCTLRLVDWANKRKVMLIINYVNPYSEGKQFREDKAYLEEKGHHLISARPTLIVNDSRQDVKEEMEGNMKRLITRQNEARNQGQMGTIEEEQDEKAWAQFKFLMKSNRGGEELGLNNFLDDQEDYRPENNLMIIPEDTEDEMEIE